MIKLSGEKIYKRQIKNEKPIIDRLEVFYVSSSNNYVLVESSNRYPLLKNNNKLIWDIPNTLHNTSVCIHIEVSDSESNKVLFETNKIIIKISGDKNPASNMSIQTSNSSPFIPTSVSTFTNHGDIEYNWYSMQDEHPIIPVINRTIKMPTNYEIVVLRDNLSQILLFEINRFFDGVDLSSKACSIEYVNANGEGGKSIGVNLYSDEQTLKVGWLLNEHIAAKEGNVNFKIKFVGYNEYGELYRWQTKTTYFKVEHTIWVDDDEVEDKYPTIIEDFQIQLRFLQLRIEMLEGKYDSIEIIPLDEIRELLNEEIEVEL